MGMLKDLVRQLQTRFADTPDTPEKNVGYHGKPSIHAGCTPDTPDTPQNNKGQEAIAKPPAPAPIPAPARTPEQAANDASMVDWHALDRAYLDHHLQCIQCKAAGRRRGERCATGAALWRAYESASLPWVTPEKARRAKPAAPSPDAQKLDRLQRAAMRACDFWGDGEEARQQMRQWCESVPEAERQVWIHYFRTTYPMEEQQ